MITMIRRRKAHRVIVALTIFLAALGFQTAAYSLESTMPPKYKENIDPTFASKYTYIENGKYTKALNIPTYEWMPADSTPKAIVLGIHGLTLHARRFRVLARSLACNGIGFIALDMRGFGASYFNPDGTAKNPDNDDRTTVRHLKSYEEVVELAKLVKQDYPKLRVIALGESLGCTFCVRLAAEHPELISGTILSAPAVRVNHSMYAGKGQIKEGIKAAIKPHHNLDLRSFFAELCSNREDVKLEMMDDPFVRKELSLRALIATDLFVERTAKYAQKASPDLEVLILQGGRDGCVSPTHVTDLMKNLSSDHQTLAWRGNFGHLQLETSFMRAETLNALSGWLALHNRDNIRKLKQMRDSIASLGGTIIE